jgi:membrane fusion protein (multidrug efflux system)
MALVSQGDLWVTANFKETQLKDMRAGQSATIEVDGVGREFKGHVDSIAAATGARFSLLPPENATGNYVKVVQRVPVKIVFEPDQDPEHRLRPGMSVSPTVLTK